MYAAAVKILDGELDPNVTLARLNVNLLEGQLGPGGIAFLQSGGFPQPFLIHQITKNSHELYELNLEFYDGPTTWAKFFDERSSTLLIGLDRESYQRLTPDQKLKYFSEVVDIMTDGRIRDVIKNAFRFNIKILPNRISPGINLTKIGGLPIVASEFTFPKDKNGNSCLFLGQISTREFCARKSVQEPSKHGILYFFASIIPDYSGSRFEDILVRFLPEGDEYFVSHLPGDLEKYGVFEELGLEVNEFIGISEYGTHPGAVEINSQHEDDYYTAIGEVLYYYNLASTITLFLDNSQLDEDAYLSGYLKRFTLDYRSWCDASGSVDHEKWIDINNKAANFFNDWMHLIDIDTDHFFRKPGNFKNEFNISGMVYRVLIKKLDYQNMNFTNTVSIYEDH